LKRDAINKSTWESRKSDDGGIDAVSEDQHEGSDWSD